MDRGYALELLLVNSKKNTMSSNTETNLTKNLKKVPGVAVIETEDLPAKKLIPNSDTVRFTYNNATLNSMAFESELLSIASINYNFRFKISSKVDKNKWTEVVDQFNKSQIAIKCIKNGGDNRLIFSCEFIYEKDDNLELIIYKYLNVLLNSATKMYLILDQHKIEYVKNSNKDS